MNSEGKQGSLFSFGIRVISLIFLFFFAAVLIFIITGYFRAVKPDSYLPDINGKSIREMTVKGNRIQIESKWYSLIIDAGGNISVETPGGEKIINNIVYSDSYSGLNDKWGLDSISILVSSDTSLSVSGRGSAGTFVTIDLMLSGNLPCLDFRVKTHYNEAVTVNREALVASFAVNPSETYLKNGEADYRPVSEEYWLGRQGVRFGSGNASALIYHPENISSLQYKANESLLFINLDFFMDHPDIRIPYQEDGGGRWIDVSRSDFREGDETEKRFSVYFGTLPPVTPRLMMVPGGYLAGYVFTEHADGADMRLNRAVYFGSENITGINEAAGGFAGHRIPVTKSVFYIDSKDCSVSKDSLFVDFLDQLYSTGLYDICLHTPEDGNSNREVLSESISYMKEHYDTRTWIDHGMYNGKNNRESFVCDGLDSLSVYYAADLWKKYDTRYFWNAGPEKIRDIPLKDMIKKLRIQSVFVELWRRYLLNSEQRGNSIAKSLFSDPGDPLSKYELNSLEPFRGTSYPTPVYWQNRTQTGDFYSWVTDYVKDFSNLSGQDAEGELTVEKRLLDRLVADRGIYINHGYFVRDRAGIEDGTFEVVDGVYKVGSGFDRMLQYMEDLRDKGDLYVTTVRDLLDYLVKLENISFSYGPDGSIYVYNANSGSIKGLSMVAKAGSVRIDGQVPESRIAGEEIIFWFDLSGNTGTTLTFN